MIADLIFINFVKLWRRRTSVRRKTDYAENYVVGTTIPYILDSGYPHDGHADKNPHPHDRRADKDSYPHDSNNQCIILRLQLSFVMINVQLMLV